MPQQLNEGIHSLSTRITSLMNNSKFQHKEMKETLEIMLLQHVVRYHKACDWIWLQDQQQLSYQSLLSHCQLLKTQCKQHQKAKENRQANLTTLTAATASSLSIHQDGLTTHPKCPKCGYLHPHNQCPTVAESVITVVACSITLPCVEDQGDPIIQPEMTEPNLTPK